MTKTEKEKFDALEDRIIYLENLLLLNPSNTGGLVYTIKGVSPPKYNFSFICPPQPQI